MGLELTAAFGGWGAFVEDFGWLDADGPFGSQFVVVVDSWLESGLVCLVCLRL